MSVCLVLLEAQRVFESLKTVVTDSCELLSYRCHMGIEPQSSGRAIGVLTIEPYPSPDFLYIFNSDI